MPSFSKILLKGSFEELEESLKGKRGQFLEGRSEFVEIAIINFTSQILFDLLVTCRMKDLVSLVIFYLRF